MKEWLGCLMLLLLFTGCTAEKEPAEKITVTSNDPTEVSRIVAEERAETSQENDYFNRTYVKEHAVKLDPQQPLSQLLFNYSWYNQSQILTFKPDQQIISSQFQGSRTKQFDSFYGKYELRDESTLAIHIDGNGNHNPNIIDDYLYTVTKEETTLQLLDSTINPPSRVTLQAVEKLHVEK